jgi:hypothetical protein
LCPGPVQSCSRDSGRARRIYTRPPAAARWRVRAGRSLFDVHDADSARRLGHRPRRCRARPHRADSPHQTPASLVSPPRREPWLHLCPPLSSALPPANSQQKKGWRGPYFVRRGGSRRAAVDFRGAGVPTTSRARGAAIARGASCDPGGAPACPSGCLRWPRGRRGGVRRGSTCAVAWCGASWTMAARLHQTLGVTEGDQGEKQS